MFRCINCGKLFEKPGKFYEYSEFWGAPGYTPYNCSPCCKEDYEEIDEDDITEDDEIYEEYEEEYESEEF